MEPAIIEATQQWGAFYGKNAGAEAKTHSRVHSLEALSERAVFEARAQCQDFQHNYGVLLEGKVLANWISFFKGAFIEAYCRVASVQPHEPAFTNFDALLYAVEQKQASFVNMLVGYESEHDKAEQIVIRRVTGNVLLRVDATHFAIDLLERHYGIRSRD